MIRLLYVFPFLCSFLGGLVFWGMMDGTHDIQEAHMAMSFVSMFIIGPYVLVTSAVKLWEIDLGPKRK